MLKYVNAYFIPFRPTLLILFFFGMRFYVQIFFKVKVKGSYSKIKINSFHLRKTGEETGHGK